jgi:3-hydroxybutyryl-CoA dehydratase
MGRPVALGPTRVDLSQSDADGLASLLSGILAQGDAHAGVPHIAAMRLLADAVAADNVDFGLAGQGRAVIHEAQTIRTPVPIVAGTQLIATGSMVTNSDEAATLSLTLRDDSGVTVCMLETRLRFGDLAAMARTGQSRARGTPASGSLDRSLPITAAHVLRYAALSGDGNPIHLDPSLAVSAGLPERVVHGMLLVGLAEVALGRHCAGGRLAETRTRFVAPVFVGESVSLDINERGLSPGGARLARVSIATRSGQIACIVDAAVEPA